MGFRNFNINVVVRIILIILTVFVFGIIINEDQKAYTKFLLALLIVIQSILLIVYLNKINKEIIRFLEILNISDSSYRFSSELKGNFATLAKILNNTADLIVNSRIEKEQQFRFLQFVIEQINIGLLAIDERHEIQFVNSALSDLTKKKNIRSITDLDNLNPDLVEIITNDNLETSFQIKIYVGNNPLQILIQKKLLKMNNKRITLISMQNITAELDKKELDSWQRLIRILTHEIMNSITPIINLSYSIRRSLRENDSDISNAIEDVEIIENRSKGLLQFVENYRKLTRVGKIELKNTNVTELIEKTVKVFKEDFNISGVACTLNLQENIQCQLDEKLFEQVLINILRNALDATVNIKEPKIEVTLKQSGRDRIISISDNGKGIEEEKLDDIFIPFYTTKEKGTGIGLSFVKQIINLHKGTISVVSKLEKGTTFNIII